MVPAGPQTPQASAFPPVEDAPINRPMMRQGQPCPRCGLGKLDYNGLLDLECPACGYTEGSGAGCT